MMPETEAFSLPQALVKAFDTNENINQFLLKDISE